MATQDINPYFANIAFSRQFRSGRPSLYMRASFWYRKNHVHTVIKAVLGVLFLLSFIHVVFEEDALKWSIYAMIAACIPAMFIAFVMGALHFAHGRRQRRVERHYKRLSGTDAAFRDILAAISETGIAPLHPLWSESKRNS
jgi:hypothetical protein